MGLESITQGQAGGSIRAGQACWGNMERVREDGGGNVKEGLESRRGQKGSRPCCSERASPGKGRPKQPRTGARAGDQGLLNREGLWLG